MVRSKCHITPVSQKTSILSNIRTELIRLCYHYILEQQLYPKWNLLQGSQQSPPPPGHSCRCYLLETQMTLILTGWHLTHKCEIEFKSSPISTVWAFSCMRKSCPQSVAAVFTPNTTRYPTDSTHRKGERRKSLSELSVLADEHKHNRCNLNYK